jgi:hypothetical protein
VSDLEDVNKERDYEEQAKMEREKSQQQQHQEERPGVIGSVLKAVHERRRRTRRWGRLGAWKGKQICNCRVKPRHRLLR